MTFFLFLLVGLLVGMIGGYVFSHRQVAFLVGNTPGVDITFEALHEGVRTPERATEGSAAYDAFAYLKDRPITVWRKGAPKVVEAPSTTLTLEPQERAIIPLGFKLGFNQGAACFLMPKSGRAAKEGLTLANAVGLGDADYPDEYGAIVVNTGTLPVTITHDEKVVQLCFVPVYEASFTPGTVAVTTTRSGGFGHTGLASKP